MSHSPFPYYIDPHVPTAVFDANGWKFAATTPGQMFPEIDPETAADNAALIAAIPEMVQALAMFLERVERHGNWDDGCFYYNGTSASELQEPMELTRSVLASIGKKP